MLTALDGGAISRTRRRGREHWARELASGRVRLASDVRRRLPTGGEIPEEWFAAPESLDAPVPPDSFFRVVRHVHEPCVGCEVPRVLLEDSKLVFVDKPAGVPTLAGCGPKLQGENNATRLLNRTRAENAGADEELLFAVNRIDKPVSGVWILAKGSRLAARCRAALAKPGHETKTYLARVRGAVNGPIRIGGPLRRRRRPSNDRRPRRQTGSHPRPPRRAIPTAVGRLHLGGVQAGARGTVSSDSMSPRVRGGSDRQ